MGKTPETLEMQSLPAGNFLIVDIGAGILEGGGNWFHLHAT